MTLSERSIRIKELISGQVDMGTFGLVELELIEFDKELHELKKLRVADVSNRRELLIAFMENLTTEDLTQIEIAEFNNVANKFLGN
jgi:hypothetical protein